MFVDFFVLILDFISISTHFKALAQALIAFARTLIGLTHLNSTGKLHQLHKMFVFSAPNFVSSLEDEDFVYFFFREAAVEHINCGKSIFSRVARVCKSDTGGKHKEHAITKYFLKNFMKEGKK